MERTQEEILTRVQETLNNPDIDPYNFEASDLIVMLSFENAQEWIEDHVTEEMWEVEEPSPREKMLEYMPYAWTVANEVPEAIGEPFVIRSLSHFSAWLWLEGNDELAESIRNFDHNGKPQLIQICEYLEVDHTQWSGG